MDTARYLSKYERARILGERARALSAGASPRVTVAPGADPLAVAERELCEGVLDIVLRRKMPNGTESCVDVKELLRRERRDVACITLTNTDSG